MAVAIMVGLLFRHCDHLAVRAGALQKFSLQSRTDRRFLFFYVFYMVDSKYNKSLSPYLRLPLCLKEVRP